MARRLYPKWASRGLRRLYTTYESKCRSRNMFWEITLEQLHKVSSTKCAYCGKNPTREISGYRYSGLDRKNNKKGYYMGNVVPSCYRCNSIKGEHLTHAEMLAVARALRRFKSRRPNR